MSSDRETHFTPAAPSGGSKAVILSRSTYRMCKPHRSPHWGAFRWRCCTRSAGSIPNQPVCVNGKLASSRGMEQTVTMECSSCSPTPVRKDRPHTFFMHEMSRCPTCAQPIEARVVLRDDDVVHLLHC